MRILMVNNQLGVLGGSETYMFSVGEELEKRGHVVQYFGKEDPERIHTNTYDIYAKETINPFSVIVNRHNVKLFAKMLDLFHPDIIHLNLIYYILTPAIINEARKRQIPIIQTIHDPKIVCPNHRLYRPKQKKACLECIRNGLKNCLKYKCVKNSFFLSALAVKETSFYRKQKVYRNINKFIFPSEFMKRIHLGFDIDEKQCIVIHNFSRIKKETSLNTAKIKDKYVLYFGRLSVEKGMGLLREVMVNTPNIRYLVVGDGPCRNMFVGLNNCTLVGFLSGQKLVEVIKNAAICVFPSIWYENCPMSILESISLGVPVIGANIGGIPELIDPGRTGFTFIPSSTSDLKNQIEKLYFDDDLLLEMSKLCLQTNNLYSVDTYVDKLEKEYFELVRIKV